MSEPERMAETIATVFKVPASVPPWTPPEPPTFEESLERARKGERGQWDAFSREQLVMLWSAYWDSRWDDDYAEIRVPSRFIDASLETPRPTGAITRVRQYLEQPMPGDEDQCSEYHNGCCLLLTGPTGVGKTYAAVAALRRLQRHGYRNGPPARRFRYFPALCGALLDPARRKEALEEATAVRVLVLDDLGVEYVKEGGLIDTFLDEIIWTRESEYLPTIITTNLTTDQLKTRLPGRLVDRLRGDWGRVFECPGESLRGQSEGPTS